MKPRDLLAWRLYVILDRDTIFDQDALLAAARATLEGGARIIQLRDKRSAPSLLLDTARALQALADAHHATFIVNDHLDVALEVGVDGVHLGPHDLDIKAARAAAPDLLIGGSAGDLERASHLIAHGADYLGVGAIFDASASKPDASHPRGVTIVQEIRRQHPHIPLVGIGGITLENARQVIDAGADGVAVIRAVITAPDPSHATRELLAALR